MICWRYARDYTLPHYGFLTHWLKFAFDREDAGQASPGSSGPGHNLGQDLAVSSPITIIKTTAGYSWTAAPRAVRALQPQR